MLQTLRPVPAVERVSSAAGLQGIDGYWLQPAYSEALLESPLFCTVEPDFRRGSGGISARPSSAHPALGHPRKPRSSACPIHLHSLVTMGLHEACSFSGLFFTLLGLNIRSVVYN